MIYERAWECFWAPAVADKPTDDYVVKIANRVVAMLRGRWPNGLTRQDALGDATVLILTLAPQYEERMSRSSRPRSEWPSFEAWLVKRTWGDLCDQYARKWRRAASSPECELTPSAHGLAVPDPADTVALSADVQDAIDKLPETEGYAVRCLMYGMTQAEIGDAMGYSQPYASALLQRAKAKLAVLLADYRGDDS